nr:hypothetical protein [Tanacetum cinerariifolium]
MVLMVPYEAFACRCGAEDVVLRESYQPKIRGKLYYACLKSKPRQNYYGCQFFLWKEERVGLLIGYPGGSSIPSFSPGTSSTPIYSPTPSTPPIHYGGSPSNTECSNCKHLLGMIKLPTSQLSRGSYNRVKAFHISELGFKQEKQRVRITESSAAGTDNRPPMLEESDFDSWKICIERYIRGEGKQQIQVIREKTDEEFTEAENNKERADIQAINILSQEIPTHQRNTKFLNNLPSYWGKYVTIVKSSKDISTASYVSLYTHLKSYEQHAMNTLNKMNQTSGNADPLSYMAHAPNGFQKQFPFTTTSSEPLLIQRPTLRFKLVRSQQRVSNEELWWFKDKALLMEAKEKGVILDIEAKDFLAAVECTVPHAEPLAVTTTTTFEVSHEDAYNSDVDEAPHAAAAFMANLMQIGPSTRQGANNQDSTFSEVQTYDNHFFDNLNHQVSQAMHQGEQLDSDVDSDVDDDDNTIPYHQYQLNSKVESDLTDLSSVIPDGISVITILDDLRSQLVGHIKANKEHNFANETLKAELERYKTQVQNLEQSKDKRDLEQLVFEQSGKLKADKNALEESYLEELVCLRNTNKVATKLLQSYGQPVQTVPMLTKRLTFATKDLHKTVLGYCNLQYLKSAQLSRPSLYLGDVIVDPLHTPFRVHDSKDTLVQAEVSRTKMSKRMKGPKCKVSSKPINYAKLNSLYDTFVPQKELSREQKTNTHRNLPARSEKVKRVEKPPRNLNKKNRWSRHMIDDRSKLINFIEKFIGIVRFGNDQFAAI